MYRFFGKMTGGRLHVILILAFSIIAGLTVGLGAIATSKMIREYLRSAEDDRVARDMVLARAFFDLKLDEMAAISHRLVLDPWVTQSFAGAALGEPEAIQILDQQISNKITVLALGGTHLIALLDPNGKLLVARVQSANGALSPVITEGQWGELPILQDALSKGITIAATEVIPVELLDQIGLAEQARIPLLETAKAALQPFDPREGSAGLTLTGVSPLISEEGSVIGAALSTYLFNKDYTLVDHIKDVAGIDTVTIFFGDLRVSTNVPDEYGNRAIGTRVSQAVFDDVLLGGRDYVGEAFVVKANYITRYEPLRDHKGNVVGILYVGALKSTFQALLDTFHQRVVLIALVCIGLAAVIGVPISRLIVWPITELVKAHRHLAMGDMSVRVPAHGRGELAVLARSFNTMAETLFQTQQKLLHKEKLASVGQLAAGVAHEINNPLGTILLFADMLYKDLPEEDPKRSDLRMILNETTRCKAIVADLLNFARQQQVMAQETDVNSLLEKVIEGVQPLPAYREVEIIRDFSPDLPIIQSDPSQLQQVFVNLLNNAAEAINGKGTIALSTQDVDGQWVEIKVADSGCGMSEEVMSKLYTPFFTTKSLGKGTGLGLSIVYGIIKMHRGQIAVQSKVGRGTTFTITLPVKLFPGASGSGNTAIGGFDR